MNSKLKALLVLIILVGMPAFAWYYLQKGTGLRKEALEELKPKGVLGQFESPTEKEIIVKPDLLKGKRWMIAILGTDEKEINASILLNIYKQSKEEFIPNVFCLVGLELGEGMPSTSQKLKLPSDNPNWLISYFAKDHLYPFCKDAFGISEPYKNKPCIILVDENLQIRNTYLLADESQIKKLVRHYPVFLSLKK